MRRIRWGLVAIAALGACNAEQEPGIDVALVERVLGTLASDDMEGRGAFAPGGDRAREFLAGEFARIGLDPVSQASGHTQTFRVFTSRVTSLDVSIDGRAVPPERLAASTSQDAVYWRSADDVRIQVVGPSATLQNVILANREGGQDALLLVDPSHEATFARIRGFLGRPSPSFEPGGGTLVAVLADASAETDFEVSVVGETTELELANVVGTIRGRRPDEVVLFSGHYDHLGIRPAVDGDSIANGANDNASGATAVVALAEYFKARGEPERTLMFAAFTAEEAGGLGSRYFSQQLDPDRIVAMFNIEMIGKPAVSGPNTAWVTGFDRSDFGPILQRAVEGTEYSFYADPYPRQNLFYRSDNATLARLGVPAHSISTTPIDVDTDYHTVTDEVQTLDLDHLANTIRAIARAASTIVSGEETPSRVDPESLN